MDDKIAIIGLGYVGLPLAIAFSKKYDVIGYDINTQRIKALQGGHDDNLEVQDDELSKQLNHNLKLTTHSEDIKGCNIYIITVPTPVDKNNKPILEPLLNASNTVGQLLKSNDIIIYESTVYPGVTEDECVPVLEKASGLQYNSDFFCGYSPERINPGDKKRRLPHILKITSGSTPEVAKKIDTLYNSIIEAGTHLAPSIKVAEAAKVIENAQRDINIAFINELAKIFNKLNIDTHDVLEAAATKWNFLNFKPGLVGGHCIGVDPFYLAQKAHDVGYYSEIILAGRRLNDSMSRFVADEIIKLMVLKGIPTQNTKVLMLGITFKENCPDINNSKVVDLINHFSEYPFDIDVYDPWADSKAVKREYDFELISRLEKKYHVIIHAVAHDEFLDIDFKALKETQSILYDVKGTLPRHIADKRL